VTISRPRAFTVMDFRVSRFEIGARIRLDMAVVVIVKVPVGAADFLAAFVAGLPTPVILLWLGHRETRASQENHCKQKDKPHLPNNRFAFARILAALDADSFPFLTICVARAFAFAA
jgi:hypothetical protein